MQRKKVYKIEGQEVEFWIETKSSSYATLTRMYSSCIEDKNPCSKAYYIYQGADFYEAEEKKKGCDFVFHVEGRPLNYGTIQLNYREAQRKSGIPWNSYFKIWACKDCEKAWWY